VNLKAPPTRRVRRSANEICVRGPASISCETRRWREVSVCPLEGALASSRRDSVFHMRTRPRQREPVSQTARHVRSLHRLRHPRRGSHRCPRRGMTRIIPSTGQWPWVTHRAEPLSRYEDPMPMLSAASHPLPVPCGGCHRPRGAGRIPIAVSEVGHGAAHRRRPEARPCTDRRGRVRRPGRLGQPDRVHEPAPRRGSRRRRSASPPSRGRAPAPPGTPMWMREPCA